MKGRSCKTFLVTIAALASLSLGAFARNRHHDLNGDWKLIPASRQLEGEPAAAAGMISIHEGDGNIAVAQNFRYADASGTSSVSLTLEGRKDTTIEEGPNLKGIASWKNGVLELKTTQDGATSVERFSLQADGTMLLTLERPGHEPAMLSFQRE